MSIDYHDERTTIHRMSDAELIKLRDDLEGQMQDLEGRLETFDAWSVAYEQSKVVRDEIAYRKAPKQIADDIDE